MGGPHEDAQRLGALWLVEGARPCLVAHHREAHHDGVGRLERHLVFAFQVGHHHPLLFEARHGGQLQRIALVVGDGAFQGKCLSLNSGTDKEEYGCQQHP